MSVQDLARTLSAAGSIKIPDDVEGSIYILHFRDSDNALVEKLWVGDQVMKETFVASDAMRAPASYLLTSDGVNPRRVVYFIDTNNTIQCYVHNGKKWKQTGFSEHCKITTSPNSKLAVGFGPNKELVLFYQDPSGQLVGMMSFQDDQLKPVGPLAASALDGTPLYLSVIDDKTYLFYISKDNHVHYQILDSTTAQWQENALQNTKFDSLVVNFSVSKNAETGSFQSYFLTDGSLWNVDGDKEKTCLGKVESNGKLIPAGKEQAGWRVWWSGARYVEATPWMIHRSIAVLDSQPHHPPPGGGSTKKAKISAQVILSRTSLCPSHILFTISYLIAFTGHLITRMGSSQIEVPLEDIVVNPANAHGKRQPDGPREKEKFGAALATQDRWQDWITMDEILIRLLTHVLPEEKNGNGFFVNVPNEKYDVIFTAGHNLVESKDQYCTSIRILTTPRMVRVCQRYMDNPKETNAAYDYGVILLERNLNNPIRGFGFNLALGIAPPLQRAQTDKAQTSEDKIDVLQDQTVYVSGFRPGDPPTKRPARSTGKCIYGNQRQLIYEADAEQGMSGGAVWADFRRLETVVAIHNYGEEKTGSGNRGTRLSLEFWEQIFEWLGLGWRNKSLRYHGSKIYSMHLHMPSPTPAGSRNTKVVGRVRVGKPGLIDTLFDVIPVSALPGGEESDAFFAFRLRGNSKSTTPSAAAASNTGTAPVAPSYRGWLRWDAQGNQVYLDNRFQAQCEVKLPDIITDPDELFDVQVRLNKTQWLQVRMGMAELGEEDLENLNNDEKAFEDTSEITFMPITQPIILR
ncbi:hypothetical protein HD806DRAFT_527476 [Xylariaceae sp. AK1471]|nr:hypothetical protein HD806DRAFT_527476 [Xylariaceae sp. AK1471]